MEHDKAIPESSRLVAHLLVPPAPRMFRETTGLCIEDFMTLGLEVLAQLSVWRPGKPLIMDLRDNHGIDADQVDRFFQVIAQDIGWFAAQLVNYGPWDFVQFETTPVISLKGGRLALNHNLLQRRRSNDISQTFHDRRRRISLQSLR